jgi:tRNA threonylcarbamoyladenosine biosynthesis protein TsaB
LDLLAYPLRHSDRLIVPVIDARRGEVYTAAYRQVPGGVQRVRDPQVISPDELAGELLAGRDDVIVVGDGAIRYADVLRADSQIEVATVGSAHPSVCSLVELAQPKALREQFVQPWELEVMYLRKSDAEINWGLREPQTWQGGA